MTVSGSFRDPSGRVFAHEGGVLREVRQVYWEEYDRLMGSGLYEELVADGLLVAHQEIADYPAPSTDSYKVLKPVTIPFISYPYEWSFSQLKDAALTTLEAERIALGFGMSLKDASAFNVQFLNGRPTIIDTLSFQKYREGEPWTAYKQFCQHFLAPLAVMNYLGIWAGSMSLAHLDGVPLDLASSLLPLRSHIRPSIQIHLHLHARMIEKYSGKSNAGNKRKSTVSLHSRLGLIDNLKTTVEGLRWNRKPSTWTGYYEGDSYTPDALGDKARLTQQFLKQVQPGSVWDLGANTGRFSRLASEMGIQTVAFDQDPAVVEGCYQTMRKQEDSNLLPLVMDLANPSPPIGWANRERLDLAQRGPVDMVLALALIHHLAIANNVPFRMIAKYFKSITRWALVEFVPRTDPKAMLLMETRQDSFEDYTQERFEDDFGALFRIEATVPIAGSERLLYLLKSR